VPFGSNFEARIETRRAADGSTRQILVLEVDLGVRLNPSESGKSTLIGTTSGTRLISQLPGWPTDRNEMLCLSASVFQPVPSVLREARKRKNAAANRGFF